MPGHQNGPRQEQPAHELRGAAAEIASLRRLALQRALLAVVAAAVAGLAAGADVRLGAAFAVGSLAELALAAVAESRRRGALLLLAADRDGYALAEVRRFGASLTTRRRRLALARSIEGMLRDASRADSIFLLDRVAAQAPAFAAIAQSLADEDVVVEPMAMATLLRLLTDGGRSPLLCRAASPEELRTTVARILRGLHRRHDAPAA